MLLQRVVDELRAVVRIKARQGKWQALLNADEGVLDADEGVLDADEGVFDALGLLVPDARALSPTGEDVSGRERPKILAPMAAPEWATVSPSMLPGRSTP